MTSIWGGDPAQEVVNADNSYKSQRFIAAPGQTVFILTDFVYAPATGSLMVLVSGVDQFIGIHYLETNGTTVTFTAPCEEGDEVVIRGLIGSTGAQSAADSAAQAQAALDAILGLDLPSLPLDIDEGGTGEVTKDAAFLALAPSPMIASVVQVTGDYTIPNGGLAYFNIATTALGKSITLPDATLVVVGTPRAGFDNRTGNFPVGIRDSSGVLIGALAVGGVLTLGLKDKSTSAGVWTLEGVGYEPGLITMDVQLGNAYSTSEQASVALTPDLTIHFARIAANGVAAIAVDNAAKVVGTPVALTVAGSASIKAAFRINNTQAIVFYGPGSSAVVLTVTGTSIALGTPVTAVDSLSWASEDSYGAPQIAQLSPTLYVSSWSPTGTSYSAIAISVAGSVITLGTSVTVVTATAVGVPVTIPLSATTALTFYKTGGAAPFSNFAIVLSVAGTVITVNTPLAVGSSSNNFASSYCQLSATKFLLGDDNNATQARVWPITLSGVTLTLGTLVDVTLMTTTGTMNFTAFGASRYNPHLFPLSATTALVWFAETGSPSRVAVLTEAAGVVTAGAVLYGTIYTSSDMTTAKMLPPSLTEFISFRGPPTSGPLDIAYNKVQAHKIAGNVITLGTSYKCRMLNNSSVFKLSQGDYVIMDGRTGVMAMADIQVFRNTGDSIQFRGTISPVNGGNPTNAVNYSQVANRIAFTGSIAGTDTSTIAPRQKFMSLEIAK